MKKYLFALIALVACGMAATAATKYEINVGGVEVTSSNADNVTGGDITVTSGCSSGYVRYIESSNRLILYNITIHRTGSGDYAIHNRKCDDLSIEFYGTCYFTSDKAAALKLQRNTTISSQHNSYTKVYGCFDNETYAIDIADKTLTISGWDDATLVVQSGNTYNGCIYRTSGRVDITGNQKIRFENNPTGSPSRAPALNNVYMNFYEGSDVHVYGENYAIYECYLHFYDDVEVLIPYGGNYSHTEHAYFSSNYVAIINEKNFPDANFRSYLMSSSGANYTKGYLTQDDITNRTSFDYIYGKSFSDLKGIEYFTNLTSLNCSNNYLQMLNVSALTKLETLKCYNNHLASLNLPNSLTDLVCNDNYLTTLNVSSFSKLNQLNCKNNRLTNLNLSGCSQLWRLECGKNNFTTLELNGLPAIQYIYCEDDTKLTSLKCQNNPHLAYLSVANCTALDNLYCNNNLLSTLKLTGCSKLSWIDCSSNYLYGISTLGDCTSLKSLNCSNNKIYGSDMTSLVNALPSLPSNWVGNLLVIGSGTENNKITSSDMAIARNKRWIPKKYVNGSWVEIVEKGDVNGDGKLNVSDVTALINMILGTIPKDPARGDINGDGNVNVSDVTALVNIILGQN